MGSSSTIVNPGGASLGSQSQIDQAFGSIYNMFGNLSGGGTGPFGVSPQPLSSANNPLTANWYGLANLAGTTAPSLIQQGGQMIGTSMPVTQTGLDIQAQGLQPMETGLNTMQPSIDFYNQLLSGSPQATAQALAPTAANLSQIYSGATNQASQGMPQGGYRASTLAGLPFAQAAQVGNAALALQPAAAQALGQLGTAQAGIGGQIAGVGQGVSQTGLGVGQLGSVLTGQGLQSLQNTIADVLQKMGINIQGGTASTFSEIVGAL